MDTTTALSSGVPLAPCNSTVKGQLFNVVMLQPYIDGETFVKFKMQMQGDGLLYVASAIQLCCPGCHRELMLGASLSSGQGSGDTAEFFYRPQQTNGGLDDPHPLAWHIDSDEKFPWGYFYEEDLSDQQVIAPGANRTAINPNHMRDLHPTLTCLLAFNAVA
jgi:hypothetical protein